jgi:predicted  nucleic acid-binding Zn-ribbon protein
MFAPSFHEWNHLLERIANLEEAMTDVNADQQHLDTEVADLEVARTNIEAEIAALKAVPAGTPLNFAALDAAVSKLAADGTPAAPAAPTA